MFSNIRNLIQKTIGDNSETSIDNVEPSHSFEMVALRFISDVNQDKYKDEILDISTDSELAPDDRIIAFRELEEFIKTQDWQILHTFVDVVNLQEDAAECYLYGSKKDWLVFYIEYHYNISQWLVGAYEIPTCTFSRPAGESFNDYVVRSIKEGQQNGSIYQKKIDQDGHYFISYPILNH
jgi:hypothetical protein